MANQRHTTKRQTLAAKPRKRVYPRLLSGGDAVYELINKGVSSKIFLRLTLLWFVIQSALIAVITRFNVPPDEAYHYQFIQLFTKNGWLPFIHNQNGFYSLGEVSKTPFFLYHYLLSIPDHLFIHSTHQLLLLRLTNVLLGLASVYVVYKIGKQLKLPDFVTNLSVFMLANTLMFVFISASVNYDNLFILLSLLSVLLLLKIFRQPTVLNAGLLITALMAGMLTKINFLPVAFMIFLIAAVWFFMKAKQKAISYRLGGWHYSSVLVTVLFVVVAGLFVQRYGMNLVRYGAIEPACTKVLSIEECRQDAGFSRTERLDNTKRPPATKGIVEYTSDWLVLMSQRIYGVFSHRIIIPSRHLLFIIQLLAIVLSVIVIRKFDRNEKLVNLLLYMALFYLAALMHENHNTYEHYGSFDFSVQGRYSFFALPLLYLVGIYYMTRVTLHRKILISVMSVVIVVVLFVSSLPSYLLLTDRGWLNAQGIKLQHYVPTLNDHKPST